jgi:O-glycosyl hydrolase
MIRFVKINFIAVFFILLVLCMNLTAQTVNIDMGVQHQIIRGFGGIHINSWTGQQMTRDMQEKAFSNNPGEMGLSIFRIPFDPISRMHGELSYP